MPVAASQQFALHGRGGEEEEEAGERRDDLVSAASPSPSGSTSLRGGEVTGAASWELGLPGPSPWNFWLIRGCRCAAHRCAAAASSVNRATRTNSGVS
uniref:Uncharacterized protein n=1 Tax=Aegilops tauschii TaxID=37682 RepID=M8AWQ3_AEGTA